MSGLTLVPSTDAHFAWLLGEADAPDGLRVPPGGVDQPWVLEWLRRTLPRLGGYGSWLVSTDSEVVGLGGYKWPPSEAGDVEIGYAIAPERRQRGYARAAAALILGAARQDPRVRAVTAETALANLPSQRVLAANGFFQVGRNTDDDEGEMIVWRHELWPPQPVDPPPALLAQRLDALYQSSADGRIVRSNEWDGRPAPRFHLMLTARGSLVRFGQGVPADVARRLEALGANETWDPGAEAAPSSLGRYVEVLAAHAPVERIWSGPAFAAMRDMTPFAPVLDIDASNAGLLRGGFDDWMSDAPHRRPFVALVRDARAVSICASVRISPTVHCAGVETHPDHRRRGHALAAVSGWAQRVQGLGATPFYSTSWDNIGSRRVAARLGFQLVAHDLHIA
jgi:RimJ/RimL family protein N-acetyltransferase